MSSTVDHQSAIAIVGLGCRVPGANGPQEFWRNLRDGVESVRRLSREELLAAGLSAGEIANPRHVPAAAIVADMDKFDAAFFGVPAREAELMDPQHRIFLECAWETLEDAGYDPARFDGAISVFGGGIFDSYVTWNLLPAGVFDDKAGTLQTVLSNEKDYMTARVAYKLNLRGAACNVQTGCSTSLVAVHLACQSLLNYESDIALAGGVAVDVARRQGYYYHEGSVYSPDGHCRAFDADARGTVFGNGAAIVALKRLEDAIADGDSVRAIILGTAINNDGSLKVGFTAPSVTGQSQVIVEALAAAGVGPETIGYIETHGTGTALGDPIEIQAMARAFAGPALRPGSCPIGSVKTNIGHLDAAAGVSGLIKAVLALEHRLIPPTLHFKRPNPELELHRTPFAVAAQPLPWTSGTAPGVPRRAGVSSFGIGGTNAHAVIEEAPAAPPPGSSRPYQLLVLSGRSASALDAAAARLADHLRASPEAPLADVAFTLQTGRALFGHRRVVVCRDAADAIERLEGAAAQPALTHESGGQPPKVAFMFPGQGAQYAGMARRLYESEPVFRREVDACAAAVRGELDLLAVIRDGGGAASMTATAIAQPALFAVEYALAQLWRHWGVEPDALIGHSVGEYVAACLAGVFSRDEAVRLVAERGRLMQEMAAGGMTAVPLPPDRLQLRPDSGLDVAAVNAPSLTVVSGPVERIERFEAEQRAAGVECRRLHTSHAFHSAAMDPMLDRFTARVAAAAPRRPERRFISNLTGTWITDEQATSPAYWARHLRAPVLFADGVSTIIRDGVDFLLEAGPGRTLATLARAQQPTLAVAASLPGAIEQVDDHAVLLDGLGRAWLRGITVNWKAFYADERRRRAHLPTYPFERTRHWIEPDPKDIERRRAHARATEKNGNPAEWLYARGWKQTPPVGYGARRPDTAGTAWLVLSDGGAVSRQIVSALEAALAPQRVAVAALGADFDQLLASLPGPGETALRIVHLGSLRPEADAARESDLERGFYSVARLGAALARSRRAPASVKVLTSGIDLVMGSEPIVPDRATVTGACLSLQQELPNVRCQRVDLAPGANGLTAVDVAALVMEILGDAREPQVAIRTGRRWVPAFDLLDEEPANTPPLRPDAHYLVVGGLGTIGFTLAWYLARTSGPRLSIVSRTALPPRPQWQGWIDTHQAADPIATRIVRIAALEKLGSQVLPLAADAADASALRAAVLEAERQFGPLHGVITAAGLMDESAFATLDRLDARTASRHFRPKLDGLPALADVLGPRDLDFCIVTSSLSSVLGGVGYATYAAANAYLDAFVQRRNLQPGAPWRVVNWDAWHPLEGEMPATSLLARLAMTPGEGASAFERILRYRGLPQVFVSTADLPARLAEYTEAQAPLAVTPADSAPARTEGVVEEELEGFDDESLTPTEHAIVSIWQQVLGVGGIQVYDSFLDLGGSSLTAIQVIGRIDEQLGVKVAIEEFIFQTAGQLAALCDSRRAAVRSKAEEADEVRT